MCINSQFKEVVGVSPPHLGYVANTFGSCVWRIWVMLQTHLGHVDNFRGCEMPPLLRGNEGAAVYISESGLYLRGTYFEDVRRRPSALAPRMRVSKRGSDTLART